MSRMGFDPGRRVGRRCAAAGLTVHRRSRATEVGVTEQPVEPPAAREDLPPDVREQLVRLIAGELGAAWDAAVAAGADPARLAETIEERRRAIEVAQDDPDG